MSGTRGDAGGFGQMLREARLASCLTQAELAELSGLSVRAISDMERGRTRKPHRQSVRLLASAMGMSGHAAEQLIRAARTNARVTCPAAGAVPRQLPAPAPHFTGRAAELEMLTGLLDRADVEPGVAAIAAISGTAGVGKTALAVYWAHRVTHRFPDGQLFLDMRGFGPAGEPVRAADAIRWLLDGLGVPPDRVPASPEAQFGLYRSLLAARRVLVVLDNAQDAAQVRPLLVGSSGSMVLATSRNQLTGLVAREGATLLALDLLSGAEAHELLARCLGADRLVREPDTAGELIELCARLPLALSIAAARLAARPDHPLGRVTAQLRDHRSRLNALDAGDAPANVRSVLSWSHDLLSVAARRVFRLLGVHPGPDIADDAVASLAAMSLPAAQRALAELTRVHLVAETSPGRYSFHSLLRALAVEQASLHETASARGTAICRALDHYVHAGHAADRLLDPARDTVTLAPPSRGVHRTRLADRKAALAWFDAEHQVLLAVIRQAAQAGLDAHVWQLAMCMVTFCYQRAYWREWESTQRAALAAAQRLDSQTMRAVAQLELGRVLLLLGAHDQASAQLRAAFDLHERLGDQVGQARAEQALTDLFERQGRYLEALQAAERAHDLYLAAGHLAGTARALNNAGWCHAMLGDYQRAISCCQGALDLQVKVGDQYGQAHTWDSLGCAYGLGKELDRSISCYGKAVDLYGQLDDRFYQAGTLTRLAGTYEAMGDLAAARGAWEQALAILDDLGHPKAGDVRAALGRLAALSPGESQRRGLGVLIA